MLNDIHVSKDNISEFLKNWDEALEICKCRNINQICIGGDMWQSSASQSLSTLMAVRSALIKSAEAGITVIIAEGNHCKVDREAFEGYSHVYSEYPRVEVVDDFFVAYENDELCLIVMSYFLEQGSFTSLLQECENWLERNYLDKDWYLYIHQGINGGLAHPTEKDLPAKIFKSFQKVFVGHYHDRKIIPGTNIEYIGASRQHNFGEDEEKGYTIFYSDGSTEFVKNQVNKRFVTYSVKPKQISDDFLQSVQDKANNPLYNVKMKISCTATEAKMLDKAALTKAGVGKIDVVTEDMVVSDDTNSNLDTKFDKSGIRKEYETFCEKEKIVDVQTGLIYLDKIQ